ncbi:HAMP domain-containing protein [Brevibacterium sp. JNUCC-42]|nr:HAMP domain-containing protein [Brevibacterium sp. JNUCC-42]
MRKHSVAFKLFLVTFGYFLLFFVLLQLAQAFYFESFYRQSKISSFSKNLEELRGEYTAQKKNQNRVSTLLGNFMNENNASVAILDNNFHKKPYIPYRFEIVTKENMRNIILLSDEGLLLKDIPKELKIGEKLFIDGYYMDQNQTIMSPVRIRKSEQLLGPLEQSLDRVEGTVTSFILPTNRAFNPFYQDSLVAQALRDWMNSSEVDRQQRLLNDETIQYDWTDTWSGVPYVILLRQASVNGKSHEYIFSMTSLQPMDEAVLTIKKYYLYIAAIGIFLLVLLSVLFSRIVSRPLIDLSRTASKMARLDFSSATLIHSKDEFGQLSSSLQTMSQNLQNTLQELNRANEMLKEDIEKKRHMEQVRKEFMASVSHELRTPLGIIRGFSESLRDGVAGNKTDRYLFLILNEVCKMDALLVDMLELSKFESKAIQLQKASCKISKIIEYVISSFSKSVEEKQVKVTFDGDSNLSVYADARRIEQVIVNLLSNAIRHSIIDSEIRITVCKQDGVVYLRVENEGSPIPEKDLGLIWNQFYRVGSSRDRKSGGTGLGLAIVKQILDLHESAYGVENTSIGVAFYFTLKESDKTNQ